MNSLILVQIPLIGTNEQLHYLMEMYEAYTEGQPGRLN